MIYNIANAHDSGIILSFSSLFHISSERYWNESLHDISFNKVLEQASFPFRFGGCGLRNSFRTAAPAYWASWADSLSIIRERLSLIGSRVLHTLEC